MLGLTLAAIAVFAAAFAGASIYAAMIRGLSLIDLNPDWRGFGYAFITDPQNLGASVFLAWAMPSLMLLSARYAVAFGAAAKTGAGAWLTKYLMTATDGKTRLNATCLTGKILFSVCGRL